MRSPLKILAIGDFHGKIPIFLSRVIKKEKPDLIVSTGDFCAFYEKKLFMKYSYKKDVPLEAFIGRKRKENYAKRDIAAGKKVIKYLKKFNIPIITVSGNSDPAKYPDIGSYNRKEKVFNKYYKLRLSKKYENKNFKIIDFKAKEFQNCVFIGSHKSSYPGYLPRKKDWQKHKKRYLSYKRKLRALFSKYKKQNIIFISHNVPYKTLDKIKTKKWAKFVGKTHKGSFLTLETIKKYQPLLCICGHMHENQGKAKIGKTLVINTGASCENKYAILTINKKVEVSFKKINEK